MAQVSFDESDVLTISQRMFRQADDERYEKELIWDDVLAQRNNQWDFSDKSDWEAQYWIPMISNVGRYAKAQLMGALFKSENFFDVPELETDTEYDKRTKTAFYKNTQYWLQKQRDLITASPDFYTKFEDAIDSGIFTRIVVKASWIEDSVEEPVFKKDGTVEWKPVKRGRWVFMPIDPYRYWEDPEGLGRFKIHKYKISYAALLALAKEKSNGFDLEAVKELAESQDEDDDRDKEKSRQQQTLGFSKDKIIECYEFWGELTSEDGEKTQKRMSWTIANQSKVIRKPTKVPYWFLNDPFITAEIDRKAFQNFHSSLMEDGRALSKQSTDTFNLLSNALLFSSIRAFELDIDSVADMAELEGGIYSGKMIPVSRQQGQQRAIEPIQLGSTPNDGVAMLNVLEDKFRETTSVSEFSLPTPPSGGRTPVREGVMKDANTKFIFNLIARRLEHTLIESLLENCLHMTIQFQSDFDNPEIRAFLGEYADILSSELNSEERRFEFLKNHYLHFRARGMSNELSRFQELEKMQNYNNILMEIAQKAQALSQFGVNIQEYVRSVTEHFGFHTARWLPKFQPETQQNAAPMMGEEQMPVQGMMPPMPPQGGNGGPPPAPPQGNTPISGMIEGMLPPINPQ